MLHQDSLHQLPSPELAPPENPVEPLLGNRYELLRRMGSDPNGAVFLARDNQTNRSVAITVLERGSAGDPTSVARFQTWVELAANLNHPNVVRVVDWGSHDDRLYLVRESVQGATLAERLADDGHLPAPRAARIAADIAAALAAAHRVGVTHGELQTSNVIIGSSGLVKVAGFGAVAGDIQHDLAALGMVIEDMVTSVEASTPAPEPQVADSLFVDDSPSVDGVAPAGLVTIIDRLATTSPGVGYSSAEEAEADLRGYREAPVVATPDPGPSRAADPLPPVEEPEQITSSPLFLVTLAGLLILMIGLALYLSNAISGSSEETATDVVGVPTVVGDPQAIAVERLVAAGFLVEEELVENSDAPAGTVFAQDPPARTEMAPGELITISIAQSPLTVLVPDVVEKPRTEAIDELSALGLNVQLRRESNEVIPLDHVISQSLRAGDEAAENADITVVVSTGPEAVLVPSIAGLSVADATIELEAKGLQNVRWEFERSGQVPEESIVRTEPVANSQIELTAPITVFVSTGNNDFVPSVVGLERKAAQRLLSDMGFLPDVDPANVERGSPLIGTVVTQSPEAGSLQPLGARVKIRVGRVDPADSDNNDRDRGRGNDQDD
ncbi:MAG: PASTA domain-containing protein [Acidimicrobiales bacterium]